MTAVRSHLLREVLPVLEGAAAYQLRVAIKAIDIAERERSLRTTAEAAEQGRLCQLLKRNDAVDILNRALCEALREGRMDPEDEQLQRHLRATVMDKLAIDNPEFPLYRTLADREGPAEPNPASGASP
jgi:hypothetical protein